MNLKDIHSLLVELKNENRTCHDDIIARQDKTNGNVRALQLWRSFILGGMAVISAVIVPIILNILIK